MEELVLKIIKQNKVVNTLGAKDAIKQLLNALWLKNIDKSSVEIKITTISPDLCNVMIAYDTDFDKKYGYRYSVEGIPVISGYIDTTKIMNLYMN